MVVYVHRLILAHGSHRGRRKSIVVIVSPLEALVLDVAKAFTRSGTLSRTGSHLCPVPIREKMEKTLPLIHIDW